MKFNIPLVPSVAMEIIPPTAPNPTATPDPATFTLGTSSPCVWRGVGADTTELAIGWKRGLAGPPAGSKQDVDLPIGVKLMKRRTVKVICYMVRMPGYSDSITTSGEAHLESTLNKIFGSQINAWFEVVVKSPPVYQVDYDVDNNLWMNATTSTGATSVIKSRREPFIETSLSEKSGTGRRIGWPKKSGREEWNNETIFNIFFITSGI